MFYCLPAAAVPKDCHILVSIRVYTFTQATKYSINEQVWLCTRSGWKKTSRSEPRTLVSVQVLKHDTWYVYECPDRKRSWFNAEKVWHIFPGFCFNKIQTFVCIVVGPPKVHAFFFFLLRIWHLKNSAFRASPVRKRMNFQIIRTSSSHISKNVNNFFFFAMVWLFKVDSLRQKKKFGHKCCGTSL